MPRSNNVFSDLGLEVEDATVEAWRSDLARIVREYFVRAQMSQSAFAHKLGVKQPIVSKINNGRLGGLSVEFLLRLCVKLGTRGTATWGPTADEALVTTDVQAVTGTSTMLSSIELAAAETTEVGELTVCTRGAGVGSIRRVGTN